MQRIITAKLYNQINTLWWNKDNSHIGCAKENLKLAHMVGPDKDKHQALTYGWKLYVRDVIESDAWPTVVHSKRNP